MTLRVLLVEDDRDSRSMLREALIVEGYEVLAAASLKDARARGARGATREGGIDLRAARPGPARRRRRGLQPLRAARATPLVVISARRAEGQKIRLLDAGADDYLVAVQHRRADGARWRCATAARWRRLRSPATGTKTSRSTSRRTGGALGGEEVHLTPTEFKLLARLVRRAGQVVDAPAAAKPTSGAPSTPSGPTTCACATAAVAQAGAHPADPRAGCSTNRAWAIASSTPSSVLPLLRS
ncbi:MAG: two-component system response regulator KdpE [Rubrivivax sp.]